MAILFMDNFQKYGTGLGSSTARTRMLDGLYAEVHTGSGCGITEDPDPNITTSVFTSASTTSDNTAFRRALPSEVTTAGAAFRLWLNGLPSSSSRENVPIEFRNNANTAIVGLRVGTTGIISAYNQGTLAGSTSTPVITSNTWRHIEVKVVVHATTGSIEVRVEGTQVLLLENLDTTLASGDTDIAQIIVGNETGTGAVQAYWKDLIVWDNSGSVANSFVGTCSVFTLDVDADTSSGWSRSTGSSDSDLLDESTPDDADYISADDTLPAASIMTLTNLPEDVVSIRGLQTVIRAKKSDGGDGNVQVGLISGVSTDLGADIAASTAYTYYCDVSSLDPATAAAWTPTAVDAASIQIDRTL